MNGLARDVTADEPSQDQIARPVRGQLKIISLVQLTTSRIGYHVRLIRALLS